MKPTDKLEGVNPREGCSICSEACPVKAIGHSLPDRQNHNREKCMNFVDFLRERTGRKIIYCGFCLDRCPVAMDKGEDKELLKLSSLYKITAETRNRLLNKWISEQEGGHHRLFEDV